jgi:hypothetical protein
MLTRVLFLLCAAAGAAASTLSAQARPPRAAAESVTVVADSAFSRGGLHRWIFGAHYRDLWDTPLRVEVLDLGRFAGGLTPLRKGGGLQTLSLRLRGNDGREYAFRSVRKSPEGIVPADLRGTFVEGVIRDQMSAVHPGGALVVPPILEAAGVLHTPPLLRVMPDDPRLGEFRAEFAGLLGTIEERPTEADDDTPGFMGASRVEDTYETYEELLDQPWVKADSRAYLTARLLDLFVGDWDRHEDQWRWALIGTGDAARWQPIPRDRDQAFARYDGLLWAIARAITPQLLNFDEDYASPLATTWNGRNLDRRILTDLDAATWDSVARSLQSRVTDAVIDAAVDRLPPEYRSRNGETLRRVLRVRRDKLPEAARRYYRFLAERVAIHGGDPDDRVEIERLGQGRTEVRIGAARRNAPYYHRVFEPGETKEIRVYLWDGDDVATVRGEGGGPLVRIVSGGGRDTLVNESRGGGIKFYDPGDETAAHGASLSRKRYVQPSDTNVTILPERDWGYLFLLMPRLVVNSDVGLATGFGFVRRGFGFRRQPYASSMLASFDYSFLRRDFRVELENRWKMVQSDAYVTTDLLASGLEGLRFHGFGNGTPGDVPDDDIFLVRQKAYGAALGLGFGLEGKARLHLLARARHTVTDPDDPDNVNAIIGDEQPLGYGDFGQAGAALRLEWDSRDYRLGPTKGLHLWAEGSVYPLTWGDDGEQTFGAVEGGASTYLTPIQPGWVTLALRAGGRKVWGDYPYFEAAYLGASNSLRGYPRNRFAGDAAVFGSAELRLRVAHLRVILPGEFGIMGLADAGRVYYQGDPDESWHTDVGGGIFYAVLDRSFGFTVGGAKGDEKARLYLGIGIGF